MAASPAVARFVDADGLGEALRITEQMREITLAEHPLINTGIAGRKAGMGQVGAGVVRARLGCFTAAIKALAGGNG